MPVLNWIGKRAVAGSHRHAPYHLVHCNGGLSAGEDDSSNLLIHGDNLLALKAILPYYRKSVKCIYIDPPYNTGNEDWVYNDNVDSPTIRRWLGKTVGDKADDLARDDKWLCMMHPRLSLLRDFLRSDGAILVSIDDNEVHHLRVLMDQIFGARNHIATFVWEGVRKNNPKFAAISHDYVVCYARKMNALKAGGKWRVGKDGLPPIFKKVEELKSKHGDDYATISEEMKKWYSSLEKKAPSFQHRHYCDVDDGGVYFASDISAPGGGGPRYDVPHPRTGKPVRVPSRGWGMKEKKMTEAVENGRVIFGEDEKKAPTYKRYLHETSEQTLAGVFYQDRRAAMQNLRRMLGGKKFDFPKDVGVLKKLGFIYLAPQTRNLGIFRGAKKSDRIGRILWHNFTHSVS